MPKTTRTSAAWGFSPREADAVAALARWFRMLVSCPTSEIRWLDTRTEACAGSSSKRDDLREPLARCMTRIAVWALDFKTRQYLKGSLWFLPLLGGIAGAVLGLLEPVLTRGITVPDRTRVLGVDGELAAGGDRRRDGRADRLRRHRQRPRRPDGDEHLLGPLHAPLVPGPGAAGPARDAGRDVHVLVHAAGGGRGELRPARRRHA